MQTTCDRCNAKDPQNYLELGSLVPMRLCNACLYEDFDGDLGKLISWSEMGRPHGYVTYNFSPLDVARMEGERE